MTFINRITDLLRRIKADKNTKTIQYVAFGATCLLFIAPFAAHGFAKTVLESEAQALEQAALAGTSADASVLNDSAQELVDMQDDVAKLMGDQTLKNRNGHELEPEETPVQTSRELVVPKVETLPQVDVEPEWIPTPTPSPTPAPTPTPTPVPEYIYLDGLKPMTQREYRAYQNIQGWNYIGSSAASGSWGYTGGMCTWYVYNARVNSGLGLSNSLGAASQWAYTARAQGYWVDNTPAVGAVAVNSSANHVMFVEKVYSDGSILISEGGWNYSAYVYNRRVLSAGTARGLTYIH